MRPIHDQSCCAKLFCATQVCPFTNKSISTIHGQSCVVQHDWSCMGPLRQGKLWTGKPWEHTWAVFGPLASLYRQNAFSLIFKNCHLMFPEIENSMHVSSKEILHIYMLFFLRIYQHFYVLYFLLWKKNERSEARDDVSLLKYTRNMRTGIWAFFCVKYIWSRL
jgi:hypothetical protein